MGIIVIDVGVDAGVADFVGGFDDFGNIVGDAVDLAVAFSDCAILTFHFVIKEAIKGFPVGFANKKHGHFGHFIFLHEDENFGKFVESAEAAWEKDVDF